MVAKKAESALVVEEQETQTEETLGELEKPSELADETSSEESTKGEAETEEENQEPEQDEDTFEAAVESLAKTKAQGMKDKELQPLYKKLRAKDTEINSLRDRIFQQESDALFEEQSETLGEDEAKKRKSNRELLDTQYKDFRQKNAEVERVYRKIGGVEADLDELLKEMKDEDHLPNPNLRNIVDILNFNLMNYQAEKFLRELFYPDEDKKKEAKIADGKKRFSKVRDKNDYLIIAESIKHAHKASEKKFEPDSGKGAGGGGIDVSKLTPIERITRGLKIEEAKRR